MSSNNISFEQLQKSYAEVEALLRKYEFLGNDFFIPTLNQLRYAGNHLVNGLIEQSAEKQQDQFNRALRHCIRAKYYLNDAIILYYLDSIKNIQKAYRGNIDIVLKYIPNYNAYMSGAHKVKEIVSTTGYKNIDKFYLDIKDSLQQLEQFHQEFTVAQPAIDVDIKKEKNFSSKVFTIIVATVTVVVGAIINYLIS